MSDLKILFTSKRNEAEKEYLKDHLNDGFELIFTEQFNEEEFLRYKDIDVLVGTFVNREILEKYNIKLIQVPHAGVEGLNFELLRQYNIPVCNTHSNALPVAEYAVGLLLGIAKKIPYHDKIFRNGNWNNLLTEDTRDKLSTYSSYIYNKTIGFIGYGNIGRKISKLLSGFDCKYLAIVTDKTKEHEELDFIGDKDDLEYVLKSSDYLIVASPLTKKTRGMLNMSNLIYMKRSSYIVNISRGKVIDEESLYTILDEGNIRGAAIDAWYNYPKNDENVLPSKNFDFHKLNNIIMSPHRADLIYDEFPYLDHAIDNIIALKKGEKLINQIDLSKEY